MFYKKNKTKQKTGFNPNLMCQVSSAWTEYKLCLKVKVKQKAETQWINRYWTDTDGWAAEAIFLNTDFRHRG